MLQRKSAWSLILLSAAFGCGPGYGDLEGKVTLDDKPVRSGSVQAFGSDGLVKQSLIQDDGSYSIQKVIAGQVKIAVSSPDPDDMKLKRRDKGPKVEQITEIVIDRSKWFPVHTDYGDAQKSGVTFQVKAGQKNPFDIKLKSK